MGVVHVQQGVALHIADDAQHGSALGHQGGVNLPPVALELLATQVGQAAEGVDEFAHPASFARPAGPAQRRRMRTRCTARAITTDTHSSTATMPPSASS